MTEPDSEHQPCLPISESISPDETIEPSTRFKAQTKQILKEADTINNKEDSIKSCKVTFCLRLSRQWAHWHLYGPHPHTTRNPFYICATIQNPSCFICAPPRHYSLNAGKGNHSPMQQYSFVSCQASPQTKWEMGPYCRLVMSVLRVLCVSVLFTGV